MREDDLKRFTCARVALLDGAPTLGTIENLSGGRDEPVIAVNPRQKRVKKRRERVSASIRRR